ncbi:hypothetical protein N7463_010717 [Penicillium fimorum]|uniref:Uncharacterized protein n=1 Tax=Penicillium fimorum TaxID=1882269 RepID=A0A9W9XLC2_9EURO|nr:hypothetical protein N7463_010717 [Penicillium fimorum]
MRYIWGWTSRIYLLFLASTVLAGDDPDYNPSSNFRPSNVTGLNQLYTWAGSVSESEEPHHNPEIGFPLGDTERGTYNSGLNAVNLWSIMFPPNHNLSEVPYGERMFGERDIIMFPVLSSQPIWKPQENTTVLDNFNMTTAKHRDSFTLSGIIYNNMLFDDESSSLPFNIDMPGCNTSREYGNWSIRVPQTVGWDNEDWDEFVLPNVTVDFNAHKKIWLWMGISPRLHTGHDMISHSTIQGPIQIRFKGVLDAYHSDILDVNSTGLTWLRTVGFGNNSLNIADSSNGGCHFRSALWSFLGVPFLVVIIIYI